MAAMLQIPRVFPRASCFGSAKAVQCPRPGPKLSTKVSTLFPRMSSGSTPRDGRWWVHKHWQGRQLTLCQNILNALRKWIRLFEGRVVIWSKLDCSLLCSYTWTLEYTVERRYFEVPREVEKGWKWRGFEKFVTMNHYFVKYSTVRMKKGTD